MAWSIILALGTALAAQDPAPATPAAEGAPVVKRRVGLWVEGLPPDAVDAAEVLLGRALVEAGGVDVLGLTAVRTAFNEAPGGGRKCAASTACSAGVARTVGADVVMLVEVGAGKGGRRVRARVVGADGRVGERGTAPLDGGPAVPRLARALLRMGTAVDVTREGCERPALVLDGETVTRLPARGVMPGTHHVEVRCGQGAPVSREVDVPPAGLVVTWHPDGLLQAGETPPTATDESMESSDADPPEEQPVEASPGRRGGVVPAAVPVGLWGVGAALGMAAGGLLCVAVVATVGAAVALASLRRDSSGAVVLRRNETLGSVYARLYGGQVAVAVAVVAVLAGLVLAASGLGAATAGGLLWPLRGS